MNKAEFLQVLQQKLSILDENELKDILNEYEQHIDMKAAGAMTEEAAIADFGDIDELSADILEAYHVRADFVRTKEEKESVTNAVDGIAGSIRNACRKTGNLCRSAWKRFLDGMNKIGLCFQNLAHKCGKTAGRVFGSRKKQNVNTEEIIPEKKTEQEKNQLLFFWDGKQKEKRDKMERKNSVTLFSVLGHMFRGCWYAIVWCVKVMWNLFCISVGIMTGAFACFCIFMLGTVVVLLMMGYPLVGVTLGVLGMTMCGCSVTVLCFTLIVRKRKQERTVEEKNEMKDREEEMVHA